VTGSGRGIGRATALALAGVRLRVALVARSADQLDETARPVEIEGGTAVALSADLGRADRLPPTLRQVVDEIVDEVGAELGAEVGEDVGEDVGDIDILVNNAAVVEPMGPAVSSTPTSGRPPSGATSLCSPCLAS